jgi:AraC family transcriptional regulator
MVPYELRWRSLSSTPTHTFVLHLPQETLARTAEDVAGCDPTNLRLIERTDLHDPLLTQLALAIWRELQEDVPGGKLYAQCSAQLLALHLLRHYTAHGDRTAATPSPHNITARQLQRVIACIQDQPGQELTLEDLAQQTSFSPSHFVRLFRRATGESPHQFVLRQRLERARHLLEASDAPMAQVAAESGFADQSHFTRVFKRFLGVTPRAYREERRL